MMNLRPALLAFAAPLLLAACSPKPETTTNPATAAAAAPAADCSQLHPYGLPQTIKTLKRNCEVGFETFVWAEGGIPLISTAYLSPALTNGTELPEQVLRVDASMPPEAVTNPTLYIEAGYEPGYLVDPGDVKGNASATAATFQTSNVVPHNPVLHREAWSALSIAVRNCALALGGATVITGALPGDEFIKQRISVPTALYKVILNASGYRAFLMTNTDQIRTANLTKFEVSFDTLAKRGAIIAPNWKTTPRNRKGQLCPGAFGE